MLAIYKYSLENNDIHKLTVPFGARILTVQVQHNVPCIWVLADHENDVVERVFELFGTGMTIPEDVGVNRKYIGTFQLLGGSLVLHLFERL